MERNQLEVKSLLVSPDAPYCRRWRASDDVGWPIQAPKYFLLQGSLSTKPDSKGLADGLPLTPEHKPNCPESPQPHTLCRRRRLQIPAKTSPHPLAPSWWCPALAVTREKHYEFFTFSVAWFCRPTCRLGVAHKETQKIWLRASDFAWSWCICYLTKLCRRERSF